MGPEGKDMSRASAGGGWLCRSANLGGAADSLLKSISLLDENYSMRYRKSCRENSDDAAHSTKLNETGQRAQNSRPNRNGPNRNRPINAGGLLQTTTYKLVELVPTSQVTNAQMETPDVSRRARIKI
jgi:hypothetical protein